MKISPSLKLIALIVFISLLPGVKALGQIGRMAAGFSFASGTSFNYGETGNPGLFVKTWVTLNKANTFHVVPAITAYNRYKRSTGYSILTNYMFHGDVDLQYLFFRDSGVKVVAFGGGNVTYLTSDYEPLVVIGNGSITDTTDMALGANIGLGLELRMAPKWDFNISGKYIFSKYSQFVISVSGVYYFKSRRGAYRR